MARCDIALVTINLPLKNKLVAFLLSLEAIPLSLLGLKLDQIHFLKLLAFG